MQLSVTGNIMYISRDVLFLVLFARRPKRNSYVRYPTNYDINVSFSFRSLLYLLCICTHLQIELLRLLHLFHSDGETAALFHVNISCVVWYWSCIQSIEARLQAYTGKLILH